MYRWTGSLFVFAGLVPAVGVSGLDVTTISGTQYLAVASRYNGTNFNTDSKVLRFADAVAWHGAITYFPNPDTRNPEFRTRNPRHGTRKQRPETRNSILDTRNMKHGT